MDHTTNVNLGSESSPLTDTIFAVEIPHYVSGSVLARSIPHSPRSFEDMVTSHLNRFYGLMVWGTQEVRQCAFNDAELSWLASNLSF